MYLEASVSIEEIAPEEWSLGELSLSQDNVCHWQAGTQAVHV